MSDSTSFRNGHRTALITGASSGIGRELARVFAEHGHNLVLVARRQRLLAALGRKIQEQCEVAVETIAMDLAVDRAAFDLVEQLNSRRITVDVLVNNAGFALAGPFLESDVHRQHQLIQLNVLTPTLLTRQLLTSMVARGYGRILNIASLGSFLPGPTVATYFASKAYLMSLSRALAEELRGTGVTSTALVLGPTNTEFPLIAGLQGCRAFSAHVMSAREVAEAGYDATMRARPVVTIGIRNKLRMLPVRFVPPSVLARFVRAYHSPCVSPAEPVDEEAALSDLSS